MDQQKFNDWLTGFIQYKKTSCGAQKWVLSPYPCKYQSYSIGNVA